MPYRRSASLTPMALKAINYYMRGWTKAEAMRKAGYAEASVEGNYEKFWKSKAVKAEIGERMRKLQAKADIDLRRILDILEDLLEVSPGDVLDDQGKVREFKDLPPHIAKSLNWRIVGNKVVIESVDKLRIIELIAKLSGITNEVNIKIEGDLASKIIAARRQAALLPAPQREVVDAEAVEVTDEED